MTTIGSLVDTLKNALIAYHERPASVLFLTYNPANGKWGYYDGSMINDVWLSHSDPMTIPILFLEPAATLAAIAAEPWDDFEAALTRYATFTASRPAFTGLHHFIDVPPPASLQRPPTGHTGEALN